MIGIRLPGLEFKKQRVEAAFRKELVYGEVHAKIMEPHLLAADGAIRFAKFCLGMTRTVAQRNEHLPRPQRGLLATSGRCCSAAISVFLYA